MTATEDRDLRRMLHGTLQSVPPSPAPVEEIIRRGKRIRLRRTGAVVGTLGLAAIIAVAALAANGGPGAASPAVAAPGSVVPGSVVPGSVVPGGVIAHGTADGHQWRLTAQDIADPGYTCVPAITLNGTDADPVFPNPDSGAVVALGSSLPGVGFGFVQVAADVNAITVDGDVSVPVVTVAACGMRYHVAGFAYSLAKTLRVTVVNPSGTWPRVFTMPLVSIQPPGKATTPENPGLWVNTSSALAPADSGALAWGTLPGGQNWYIKLQFGLSGDCYEFDGSSSLGSAQMGYCGPVSTPEGPETIMALPLGFTGTSTGATGYAVQVSPATAALRATLSNGTSVMAAFCVVDGRTYAAFVVPDPFRLKKLTWLDAAGTVIASTAAVPLYGYSQFQP